MLIEVTDLLATRCFAMSCIQSEELHDAYLDLDLILSD